MQEFNLSYEHSNLLKRMLRLKDVESLPDRILVNYERVKRTADAIGLPLSDHDLLWIVMTAQEPIPPSPEKSYLNLYREGVAKVGDPVVCEWRKRDQEAVFLGVTAADEIEIRFVGKPEQYKVAPDKVRPLTEGVPA